MSLLDNAANSIRLGIEDFESGDDARLVSASRNFHAGLLLLYKEQLRRLSPPGSDEVLLKVQTLPRLDANGNLTFVGSGRKTVDTQQIKERFKALGISVDWVRLDAITRVRNDIEHYYSTIGRDPIREIISKGFLLFRDFCRGQLQEDPIGLVGHDAWSTMVEVSEVFEQERAHCLARLKSFEWTCDALAEAVLEASCPSCGSSLLEPEGDSRRPSVFCQSCAQTTDFERFAESAMRSYYDDIGHIQDGGSQQVVICPHCSAEAYHYESAVCAVCEESCDHECTYCSSSIPPEELDDSGQCGYCSHMLSKDD